VTVIIPTYNWATVLPFSIGSVLDQTFTDFELLVIGDGCTDESAEVVGGFDDPRVQWHDLGRNTGQQCGPNNEGIRRAGGDVIAYLGHDDLWLPRHLELLVGAFDAGARVVHATCLVVPPEGPPRPLPTGTWVYAPDDWIPPTSIAHDRDLALAVGGWRPAQDTGALDPEADLVRRMSETTGTSPRWVPRITSVKLPAGARPGVYKERPHHEQAVLLEQIRSRPDAHAWFEQRYPEIDPHNERTRRLRTTFGVRSRLRRLGLLPAAQTAEARRRERRVFKGLDD
jgi:hypothetical protein